MFDRSLIALLLSSALLPAQQNSSSSSSCPEADILGTTPWVETALQDAARDRYYDAWVQTTRDLSQVQDPAVDTVREAYIQDWLQNTAIGKAAVDDAWLQAYGQLQDPWGADYWPSLIYDQALANQVKAVDPSGRYRFVLEIEDGRVLRAELNGEELDLGMVQQDDRWVELSAPKAGRVLGFRLPKTQQAQLVKRPYIGITMGAVDEALAAHLGLEADEVVMISSVSEGRAAQRAGLRPYDIVTHVDGQAPVTEESIRAAVAGKTGEGARLHLQILRKGTPQSITIEVEQIGAQDARQRYLDAYGQALFNKQSVRDYADVLGQYSSNQNQAIYDSALQFLQRAGDSANQSNQLYEQSSELLKRMNESSDLSQDDWNSLQSNLNALLENSNSLSETNGLLQSLLQVRPITQPWLEFRQGQADSQDMLVYPRRRAWATQHNFNDALLSVDQNAVGDEQAVVEIESPSSQDSSAQSRLSRIEARLANLEQLLQNLLDD